MAAGNLGGTKSICDCASYWEWELTLGLGFYLNPEDSAIKAGYLCFHRRPLVVMSHGAFWGSPRQTLIQARTDSVAALTMCH